MLDTLKIRSNFKIYEHNPNLVYLDNGATTLKPSCVLDKMNQYYTQYGVNIHRGVYQLSYQATDEYDKARAKVAEFINCDFHEVIFTRNTSESLNLACMTYGEENICEGDEIITSQLEHHSSVLPWMTLAKKKKAILKYIPLNEDGRITVENFRKVLNAKTKVVALNYFSNVMGYMTPIEEIIQLSHSQGAIVFVDAAQAVAHMKIDVQKLDCDFLAFSSHKMMGPTGIGVLYGKKKIINRLMPLYYGGDMNEEVYLDKVEIKDVPYRFEAGTPAIAEIIGLGEAISFIERIGYEAICRHTKALYDYTIEKIKDLKGLTIYNKNPELPIIAFNIDGIHPHDVATIFDNANICMRAGHHCAQLLTKWLNCMGTLRVSFYIYNDYKDCDLFIEKVIWALEFFQKLNGENNE